MFFMYYFYSNVGILLKPTRLPANDLLLFRSPVRQKMIGQLKRKRSYNHKKKYRYISDPFCIAGPFRKRHGVCGRR